MIPENSLVLLALMPTIQDFNIARTLGWYRIPLKSAPKVIEVDYLAFYQGGNFGEDHRWKIEYISEYHGNELTTRKELIRNEPDHPRSDEMYYKVQIGELIKLEKPISSNAWKRICFLYTFGELLNKAVIVNDLVVKNEERNILWQKLRDKGEHPSVYNSGKPGELLMDDALLQFIINLNQTIETDDFDNY